MGGMKAHNLSNRIRVRPQLETILVVPVQYALRLLSRNQAMRPMHSDARIISDTASCMRDAMSIEYPSMCKMSGRKRLQEIKGMSITCTPIEVHFSSFSAHPHRLAYFVGCAISFRPPRHRRTTSYRHRRHSTHPPHPYHTELEQAYGSHASWVFAKRARGRGSERPERVAELRGRREWGT